MRNLLIATSATVFFLLGICSNLASAGLLEPLIDADLTVGAKTLAIPERKLTIYTLVPPEAGHGYQVEIFDNEGIIPFHLHRIQTQFIVVLEGTGDFGNTKKPMIMTSGEFGTIPRGFFHGVSSSGAVRFLAIDIPGYEFPKDVYYDEDYPDRKLGELDSIGLPRKMQEPFFFKKEENQYKLDQSIQLDANSEQVSFKDPSTQLGKDRIELGGHRIYQLAAKSSKETSWTVAILDLAQDFTQVVHKGMQHFVVLKGEMDVTIGEERYHLRTGQSLHVSSQVAYRLSSAQPDFPVRVLQVNVF